jgi:beta-lactamase class A
MFECHKESSLLNKQDFIISLVYLEGSISFLYAVIIFLALVILALGALTLHSLRDLIDLRSKVSGLQTTVQELSDASANLVKQAQELAGLNDQLSNVASDTDATGASDYTNQDSQEEGTLSPSHASSFTDSTDESLDNLLSQLKPLLPQDNGTWSVYVCNLMKNTEGTIDDQQMQAASLIKLFIMGAVYENFDSLCDTYGADSINNYLNPMITVSDNDAANTLVNMLGYGDDSAGMNAVNNFCQSHGYTSTSMGRLLLQDNTYGDNYTSVSDCGHFLKEIYQSNAGTTDTTLSHTDAMYSLLKMQERRNKIPANLPEGVKVANKTGELDDVENDAGIIYSTAKGIDLAVCFMSQDLTDSGAAQASIAQDARLIYGYYNE